MQSQEVMIVDGEHVTPDGIRALKEENAQLQKSETAALGDQLNRVRRRDDRIAALESALDQQTCEGIELGIQLNRAQARLTPLEAKNKQLRKDVFEGQRQLNAYAGFVRAHDVKLHERAMQHEMSGFKAMTSNQETGPAITPPGGACGGWLGGGR